VGVSSELGLIPRLPVNQLILDLPLTI
jgi:hypothetical protein